MNKILTSLALLASTFVQGQTVTTYMGKSGVSPTENILSSATVANATLAFPSKMFKDASGRVWFTEGGGNRLRFIDTFNNVYVRAGSLAGSTGSNDGVGTAATFNNISGVTADNLGNIYVVDGFNHTIRKITPFANVSNAQTVSTFAGDKTNFGFADGTGTVARFNAPLDILADANNNLYVSDYANNRIRKISPSGVVTTLAGSSAEGSDDGIGAAASFHGPGGMCWYNATDLLVTDMQSRKIRKVNILTGSVTTVAGKGGFGTANGDALTEATFIYPCDVAVDDMKNIYVTDVNVIRKIAGSCVTTFAGSSLLGGDTDGVGMNARFNQPDGILYNNNALYVCDRDNQTIRKITIDDMTQALPKAKFDASKKSGTTSDVIALRDSSANAIEWKWTITPNTYMFNGGTSLTSKKPEIMFMANGKYTVSLKVKSSCFGSDSITKLDYVTIGSVGLPSLVSEATVAVYPNPSNGIINIMSSLNEKLEISMYDMHGKLVLATTKSTANQTIDLQTAPKGMYLLMIKGESSSMVKKIMVE